MDRNNKIKAQATKEGNELLSFLTLFGKTIQDILKQRDFEIVYVPDNKQVSRLNYINKINSMKRISEKLVVEKEKKVKKLNMPIYIGKAVLDLSKHLMYDFFYNVVMKHYPNARLCYTDTDSFIIKFPDKLQGFTDFILKNKEHFDLSGCLNKNHPPVSPLGGEEEANEQ